MHLSLKISREKLRTKIKYARGKSKDMSFAATQHSYEQ